MMPRGTSLVLTASLGLLVILLSGALYATRLHLHEVEQHCLLLEQPVLEETEDDFYKEDEIPTPKANYRYEEPVVMVHIKTKDRSHKEIPPYYNFEKCSAAITTEEKTRQLFEPVWVHFPKCGSSFGILLHNYGCVNYEPSTEIAKSIQNYCTCNDQSKWDVTLHEHIPWHLDPYCTPQVNLNHGHMLGHRPLWTGDLYFEYRNSFVTMFRDPRRRLVSAYNDQKHSYGLPERLTKALHDVRSLDEYVRFPGIQGCMTKMVLGYYCAASVELDEDDLEEAKRRLQDYAFIGLVEYWADSVCLFNKMFGGKLRPNTMSNSRSATDYYKQEVGKVMVGERAGEARYIPSSDWSKLKPSDDPADWELYQEAKKIFFANMKKHGLHPLRTGNGQ